MEKNSSGARHGWLDVRGDRLLVCAEREPSDMERDAGANGKLDGNTKLLVTGWALSQEGNRAVVLIPAENVNNMAHYVSEFIDAALSYGLGGFDADHYLNLCATSKAHLLVAIDGDSIDGCLITMPVSYPGYIAMRVGVCAGHPGSLSKFIGIAWKALCDWARKTGAQRIEVWGRYEWEAVLSRYMKPIQKIQVLSYWVPRHDI